MKILLTSQTWVSMSHTLRTVFYSIAHQYLDLNVDILKPLSRVFFLKDGPRKIFWLNVAIEMTWYLIEYMGCFVIIEVYDPPIYYCTPHPNKCWVDIPDICVFISLQTIRSAVLIYLLLEVILPKTEILKRWDKKLKLFFNMVFYFMFYKTFLCLRQRNFSERNVIEEFCFYKIWLGTMG